MRCFLALEIPESIQASLDLTLAGAIRKSPPARWIPAENRHVTLVFVGSVRPARQSGLQAALEGACSGSGAMTLGFSGGGVFPAGKGARVVWVGLRPDAALCRLQHEAATVCGEFGFPVERRPFLPHLSLARCRPAWPVAAGVAWSNACSDRLASAPGVGSFGVDRVTLFESENRPEGVHYRVIQSYPLGRESRDPEGRDDSKQ